NPRHPAPARPDPRLCRPRRSGPGARRRTYGGGVRSANWYDGNRQSGAFGTPVATPASAGDFALRYPMPHAPRVPALLSDNSVATPRSRVRRPPERAHYDRATVFAILDAALLCHLGYVIDGKPYVTPTLFWRDGDRLLWHGSAASRMLRTQQTGI